MQSHLTRYFAVGLIAMTLTGAVLVGESSAQWGRFAQPYFVNYNANYYPTYVAWRPFGGLFAGLHGLLCHRCWLSPCCCVTPLVCDPCFDPCDPCGDFCCNSCGFAVDSCGCMDQFGYFRYYDQPRSLSFGVPSPTGFGSVTPVDGIPGRRSPGAPASQRPAFPSTYQPLTTTPLTTTPLSTPRTFAPQSNEPTVAPAPSDGTGSDSIFDSIESRLNDIPRREPFVPGNTFRNDDADTTPSTGGIDRSWINNTTSPVGSGNPYDSESGNTTMPGGQLPLPQGTGTQPGGGSSTHNLRLDLGSGTISVTVPENAKVYINGYETKMAGVNRRYVVNDLEPGMVYDYEVRIVAQVNGRTVEETQLVTLTDGQQGMVAFGNAQPQSDNVRYIAARPVQ